MSPLIAATEERPATVNTVSEWEFASQKAYRDPFNGCDLDVVFAGPEGVQLRVPAFWSGDQTWRVRFAAPAAGVWSFRTECTDPSNASLHAQTGSLRAAPYEGNNPLLKHGPIRLTNDHRSFEHADGTPFFFLGDDWWLGMTKRLRWPDEFRTLALDRQAKGFTVIKLTAGVNTDTHEFDPRSENEGGQPWEPGYARIRPSFFDYADLRISLLVELGISPSVVGSWGFYLKSMGIPKMCRHWRYCVARWGAYPVTWYLAMENDLPFYDSATKPEDTKRAQAEWTEVGKYLRQVDGFRRPVSMQSWSTRDSVRGGLTDPSVLDFDSLHMGHADKESATRCVRVVRKARELQPYMPVVPGEVCFEGIGWQNWQNVQRLVFWGSMLGGAAGFCYGANGIWQFNRSGDPFGGTSHGASNWGGDTWDVAMMYPGSAQVGLGKKLMLRYPFRRIEPHQEWLEPAPPAEEYLPPYAGGIPGELRMAYLAFSGFKPKALRHMESGVNYRAFWFDPVTGEEWKLGTAQGDSAGLWPVPPLPGKYDGLLVLEKE
ncbi:MAG: DUF5060 domain-containing protein [Candidatus Solibacter sp.]|nr:DUF5060 domain-containing protein [Candidatus Solibacter sp.]